MRQIKDFRIFRKILRKYYKRHCVMRADRIKGKRFVSYWEKEDWLGYRIDNVEQLNDKIKREIRLAVGDYVFNKIDLVEYLIVKPNVWFEHDETAWSFCGFMLTNRDAYAIVSDGGEDEYLYSIHKLIKAKNNINPNC